MNSAPHSQALEAEIKAFCAKSNLTPRESEILAILVEGVVRIKDVADRLKLSPNTVNNHVNSIFMKTRTRSKSQLLAGLLNYVAEELERARFLRQSPRVLVLDRDSVAATRIVETLEARGFRAQLVSSQGELDSKLSSFAPHFILVDLALLGEPAASFLRRVSESVTPAPGVVFIGAGNGINDRAQAMHLGAMDLIARPMDVEHLFQILLCHYIEDEKDRARFLKALAQEATAVLEGLSVTRENIGTGGIFLSATDLERILSGPMKIGDQVELKLKLGAEELVPTRGQIVWNSGTGAGVRFMNLSRRDRERLSVFLKENSIRSYIPAHVGGISSPTVAP